MEPSSRHGAQQYHPVVNRFCIILIPLIALLSAQVSAVDLQGGNNTATMFTVGATGGQIAGGTISALVLMTAQSGGSAQGGQYSANIGLYSTNATTSAPVCGNGIVESGEACDSGGSNGACPASCSASCTANSCGTGGSGGGGGGGGGAGGSPISIAPTNHTVSTSGSYDFLVPGMAGTHHVTIKSVGTDSVTLLVQSTPVEVTLRRGESTNVDINGDKIADITLLLNSFTASTVNFAISIVQKVIPQNVTTPANATQTITPANTSNQAPAAPAPAPAPPAPKANATPANSTPGIAPAAAPAKKSQLLNWLLFAMAVTVACIWVFSWVWERKKASPEDPIIIPEVLRTPAEQSPGLTEEVASEIVEEPAYPPAEHIVAHHTVAHHEHAHHTEHHTSHRTHHKK